MYKVLFTSESVGKGHPDKICDQISDSILDAYLKVDPFSKVACEVMAANRLIVIGGEINSSANIDVKNEALKVLKSVGYDESDFTIISNLNKQSPDINQGVDLENGDIGAGDQGIMFGYATNETKEYMPLSITLAHKLVERAEELRKSGEFKWAKSDMKSQVTLEYKNENYTIVDTILMSIQHDINYNEKEFKDFIIKNIINPVLKEYNLNDVEKILINPTGKFVVGGPIGDTGLTGRKIIVDTYGGASRHGGGAFSGKDATKVDRSAAYAARWVAKNLVAAGVADKLEVQLSYAIGISKPVSVSVETFNTNKIPNDLILHIINMLFDLSPKGIIEELELRKPVFYQTSYFGHFGKSNFAWERLNKVDEIKDKMKKFGY